ncbi:MAG: hypothetical protein CVU47_01175 [Chloroflexi bacterium HGW-Chloroflexi-9]|nr:MAG: hypothetical protein CVU47_01175 [Chloroflexi bacterium HGW-Chloroflexi-9]
MVCVHVSPSGAGRAALNSGSGPGENCEATKAKTVFRRRIFAPICIDGIRGNFQYKRERISRSDLPAVVAARCGEEVTVTSGIDEIERLAQRTELKLSFPGGADVARMMTMELRNPFAVVHEVYWNASPTAFAGIVDQVRNRLVELVAEMRAGTPDHAAVPSADVANQAVEVVIHGKGNRVHVAPVQASGPSEVVVTRPQRHAPKWALALSGLVGSATVVGTVSQVTGWHWW